MLVFIRPYEGGKEMASGVAFCIHEIALQVLHYRHGLEVSVGCSGLVPFWCYQALQWHKAD